MTDAENLIEIRKILLLVTNAIQPYIANDEKKQKLDNPYPLLENVFDDLVVALMHANNDIIMPVALQNKELKGIEMTDAERLKLIAEKAEELGSLIYKQSEKGIIFSGYCAMLVFFINEILEIVSDK